MRIVPTFAQMRMRGDMLPSKASPVLRMTSYKTQVQIEALHGFGVWGARVGPCFLSRPGHLALSWCEKNVIDMLPGQAG